MSDAESACRTGCALAPRTALVAALLLCAASAQSAVTIDCSTTPATDLRDGEYGAITITNPTAACGVTVGPNVIASDVLVERVSQNMAALTFRAVGPNVTLRSFGVSDATRGRIYDSSFEFADVVITEGITISMDRQRAVSLSVVDSSVGARSQLNVLKMRGTHESPSHTFVLRSTFAAVVDVSGNKDGSTLRVYDSSFADVLRLHEFSGQIDIVRCAFSGDLVVGRQGTIAGPYVRVAECTVNKLWAQGDIDALDTIYQNNTVRVYVQFQSPVDGQRVLILDNTFPNVRQVQGVGSMAVYFKRRMPRVVVVSRNRFTMREVVVDGVVVHIAEDNQLMANTDVTLEYNLVEYPASAGSGPTPALFRSDIVASGSVRLRGNRVSSLGGRIFTSWVGLPSLAARAAQVTVHVLDNVFEVTGGDGSTIDFIGGAIPAACTIALEARCNVLVAQPAGTATPLDASVMQHAGTYTDKSSFKEHTCATCDAAVDCKPVATTGVTANASTRTCRCECDTATSSVLFAEGIPVPFQCDATLQGLMVPATAGTITREVTTSVSVTRSTTATRVPTATRSASRTLVATPTPTLPATATIPRTPTRTVVLPPTPTLTIQLPPTPTPSLRLPPTATATVPVPTTTPAPTTTTPAPTTPAPTNATTLAPTPPAPTRPEGSPVGIADLLGGAVSEESAEGVQSMGTVSGSIAGAVGTPSAANKAANMERLLAAVGCRFFPDSDTTMTEPSWMMFAVVVPIGPGREAPATGATVTSTLVLLAALAVAAALPRVRVATVGGDRTFAWRVRRVVGAVFGVAVSLWGPNVVGLGTTMVMHAERTPTRLIGAACALACLGVFAMTAYVLKSLRVEDAKRLASPEEYEATGSLAPLWDATTPPSPDAEATAAPPPDGDDPGVASAPAAEAGATGTSADDPLLDSSAECSAPEPPSSPPPRAWLATLGTTLTPLFDPARDPAPLVLRLFLVEDIGVAMLLAFVSGVKPDAVPCVLVAVAQAALVTAHLLFIVYNRPYGSDVDYFFASAIAALQTLFGFACVALTLFDGSPTPMSIVGWTAMTLSAVFMVQLAFTLFVEARRYFDQRAAKQQKAEEERRAQEDAARKAREAAAAQPVLYVPPANWDDPALNPLLEDERARAQQFTHEQTQPEDWATLEARQRGDALQLSGPAAQRRPRIDAEPAEMHPHHPRASRRELQKLVNRKSAQRGGGGVLTRAGPTAGVQQRDLLVQRGAEATGLRAQRGRFGGVEVRPVAAQRDVEDEVGAEEQRRRFACGTADNAIARGERRDRHGEPQHIPDTQADLELLHATMGLCRPPPEAGKPERGFKTIVLF